MISVTLYHFESDAISIDIEARFEGDVLIIDGYDSGKKVNDYWGNTDYEYTITFPHESVLLLYPLLDVPTGDKPGLMKSLASRFKSNSCFSELREFVDNHHIPCTGFSWI
jgi:hypothetical protein